VFTKSAAFYDALYSFKDYAAEAKTLKALIQQKKQSTGKRLLDVACGTGQHMAQLGQYFTVEGLDLDANLLEIAQQRCPTATFHRGDMVDFQLDQRFDVITCLFSSIGYVKTVARLNQTVQNFARHLQPGGVVIIEPWLLPEQFQAGHPHALLVDQPDFKLCRMNVSRVEAGISILDFHYMLATPAGIETFTECHELALFTHAQYVAAFEHAGLTVSSDARGITGRGLYIGCRA